MNTEEDVKIWLVNHFLQMPDGRKWAKANGMEYIFQSRIDEMRSRLPLVSFWEMSALGFDELSRHEPITLEQARAQAQWLKNNSTNTSRKTR